VEGIKAIMFDLDDTLLDRSKTFDLYCEYFVNKFFPSDIQNKEGVILKIKKMDRNGYEARNIFYEKIIDAWNLKNKAEELENNWFEQFDKFAVPENGLMDTLKYLVNRKYKLAIITNGSNSMQNRKIDALGIRTYFDEIIISSDAGMKKPDKNIFLLACDKLKVLPSGAVYIGDNYEIDILGAVNAGLKAVWINKYKINRNYEHRINKLESIMEMV
jgi:putative hydrolase of the HAD superfamily